MTRCAPSAVRETAAQVVDLEVVPVVLGVGLDPRVEEHRPRQLVPVQHRRAGDRHGRRGRSRRDLLTRGTPCASRGSCDGGDLTGDAEAGGDHEGREDHGSTPAEASGRTGTRQGALSAADHDRPAAGCQGRTRARAGWGEALTTHYAPRGRPGCSQERPGSPRRGRGRARRSAVRRSAPATRCPRPRPQRVGVSGGGWHSLRTGDGFRFDPDLFHGPTT